jgi:transcriptional regulator with GAF, ATPase, and Fis domain
VLIVDRGAEPHVGSPATSYLEKHGGDRGRASGVTGSTSLTDRLDSFERAVIARALAEAGGNIADAARRLHTDRPNLYRRMKRLGINASRV